MRNQLLIIVINKPVNEFFDVRLQAFFCIKMLLTNVKIWTKK